MTGGGGRDGVRKVRCGSRGCKCEIQTLIETTNVISVVGTTESTNPNCSGVVCW